MTYSLVIPVYNNEQSIPDLLDTLCSMYSDLQGDLEVVFVIDGSPDNSFNILKGRLPAMPFKSRLLLHSRNYGAFAAIRSGLVAARGRYFAVMAADLQEPPELATEFFRTLVADEADVVLGTRESRDDPFLSRISSGVFWWFYRKFVIPDMPEGGVDMFGCNDQFRQQLLQLEESHGSLIGLLFWLGFRRKVIGYHRSQRKHGSSGWTFRKKINYLLDSVFSFTDLPIKLLIGIGGLGLLISILYGIALVIFKLSGLMPVPGYAATVLSVLFFGGLNAIGLGIIGEYVWRAYANTQRRPLAVVMREFDFG